MSPAHVGEDDIGFTIGPRINAASRMDAPEDAFVMLSSTDEAIASAHVAHLEKLNNERKGIVAAMTKEAKKRIASKDMLPDVLVLGDPLWRPSLAGLLANTLAQEFGRPAFVWGRDGREAIRGSCRSEGRSSVVALMDAVPDIFSEYGGHHMSGGFGVLEDKIHTFADTLNTAHASLGGGVVFEAQTQIDATLTLDEVDRDVLTILTTLAPYGMGNPKPLFLFEHVVPEQVAIFGKTKEHTKLTFKTKGHAKEAIAFFTLPESFSKLPRAGEPLSLYGHIEQSYFMGRMQTRIRIVDIV
jgi:single-stranded-DNA-specific exonuclease